VGRKTFVGRLSHWRGEDVSLAHDECHFAPAGARRPQGRMVQDEALACEMSGGGARPMMALHNVEHTGIVMF